MYLNTSMNRRSEGVLIKRVKVSKILLGLIFKEKEQITIILKPLKMLLV